MVSEGAVSSVRTAASEETAAAASDKTSGTVDSPVPSASVPVVPLAASAALSELVPSGTEISAGAVSCTSTGSAAGSAAGVSCTADGAGSSATSAVVSPFTASPPSEANTVVCGNAAAIFETIIADERRAANNCFFFVFLIVSPSLESAVLPYCMTECMHPDQQSRSGSSYGRKIPAEEKEKRKKKEFQFLITALDSRRRCALSPVSSGKTQISRHRHRCSFDDFTLQIRGPSAQCALLIRSISYSFGAILHFRC